MKESAKAALFGALAGVLLLAALRLAGGGSGPRAEGFFEDVAASSRRSVAVVLSLRKAGGAPSGGEAGFWEGALKTLEETLWVTYEVGAAGAGVALDRRGHIITNYHVIKDADRVIARVAGSDKDYEAEVVGYDPMTDLALLKVFGGPGLVPLELAPAESLRQGLFVAAIGNPYNLENSVTVGVVSATGRSDLGILDIEDFIQTDASIFPGSSGGPLVDREGRMVGLNTAVLGQGLGIGFAIPSGVVKRIAEELIREGRVARGRIGVRVQPLTEQIAESLRVAPLSGALVAQVEPGSPAQRANVARGDVIVAFGGEQVKSPRALRSLALRSRPGEVKKLDIIRDGRKLTLSVTMGALEDV
ncbi:MAG: S1C family serine protease [Candidatus Nitrospinota bacterium M3_3B_026]